MFSLSLKNRFNQMIDAAVADSIRNVVTITEAQTVTLPRDVVQIKVVSGNAWVSHLAKDTVLSQGQTMKLEQRRDVVVVTSTGRRPVTLELSR